MINVATSTLFRTPSRTNEHAARTNRADLFYNFVVIGGIGISIGIYGILICNRNSYKYIIMYLY